jgi:hypothetical protein
MNPSLLRMLAIFLLGLSAPIWWTFTVSYMISGIFQIASSNYRPTALFMWLSILVPSIMLGLVAGYGVARLSADYFLKGWGLFLATLLISSSIAGESIASTLQLFNSPGDIAFLLATAAFPLFMAQQQRTKVNV